MQIPAQDNTSKPIQISHSESFTLLRILRVDFKYFKLRDEYITTDVLQHIKLHFAPNKELFMNHSLRTN